MAESLAVLLDQNVPRAVAAWLRNGIVRLRVWPTTTEEVQGALERLLAEVPDHELSGALVIIGRTHIRVRPGRPGTL